MVDRKSSPSPAKTVVGAEELLATRKFETGTGTECGGLCVDALIAALNGDESSAVLIIQMDHFNYLFLPVLIF